MSVNETKAPITVDSKPAHTRHACPHCGKMVTFPPAADKGLGPMKTDTEKPATTKAAEDQALVGKVKKGLHAAFPKDTNTTDQAGDSVHDAGGKWGR